MQRVGDSTSTANGSKEFVRGQPGTGIPATLITVEWLNSVQRELVNLVVGGGLVVNPADDSQVFKAIQAMLVAGITWAKLAGKPTSVAGFGITDAFTKTETSAAIQQAIAALVGSSPAALDTVYELANALGNDPHFATTVINGLAAKADKATTLAGYGITDVPDLVRTLGWRARTSSPVGASGVDLNTLTTPGCSETLVHGTNPNGTGVSEFYYALVFEYGGAQLTQLLIPYAGGGGMWVRSRYSGVWSAWDKFVTVASLPPARTASLQVNGWARDPVTGEIEQWGYVASIADNSSLAVTFPMAFPEACLNGQVSFANDTGTSGTDTANFLNPTRQGFTLKVSGNNTTNSVYWRAKGK